MRCALQVTCGDVPLVDLLRMQREDEASVSATLEVDGRARKQRQPSLATKSVAPVSSARHDVLRDATPSRLLPATQALVHTSSGGTKRKIVYATDLVGLDLARGSDFHSLDTFELPPTFFSVAE